MEKFLKHPSEAEAVVFDIDGVLIDSWMSIMSQGMELIRRERGDVNDFDYIRVHEANCRSGDPRLNIPDMLGLNEKTWQRESARLMALHAEIFDLHRLTMVLYAGAVKLVDELSQIKKVAAFTTRSSHMFCSEVCPQLLPFEQPDRYFSTVITRNDVIHPKPDPEGFLKIAKQLNVSPERIVMVGDMPTDMLFLKQVGATGIGVTQFPFADARSLREAGADYVVESLRDVGELLL